MKTTRLIILPFLLFLIACNNNSQVPEVRKGPLKILIDPNQIIIDTLNLSEIAKKIEYIPLETNDSSFMGQIMDFVISEEYIFLAWRGKISIYDNNGRYNGELFKVGRGPGEVFARGYTVDRMNKLIYVFSNFEHITKIYNFDKTYLKTIKKSLAASNHWVDDIFYFDNSLIVESFQNNDSEYLLSAFNLNSDSIHVIYKDLTHGDEEINYPRRVQPIDAICYQDQDSVFLFKEIFNDTVFKVSPSLEIEPYLIADITNYELERKEKIESLKKGENAKGYFLRSFVESSGYVFFVLRSESDRQLFGIYDKQKDSLKLLTNRHYKPNEKVYLRNDLDNILNFSLISGLGEIYCYKGCLYALVEGKSFSEGYKALSPENKTKTEYLKKMAPVFEKVNEYSNPVLVKVILR